MKNSLGDALANAVVKPVDRPASSTIIGPEFIGVLEAVYRVPGISVNGVVSIAGCSWSRCKRLLELAVERGYVEKFGFEREGYFPPNLERRIARAFFVLMDGDINRLMGAIIEHPGMGKGETTDYHGAGRKSLELLEEAKLISLVSDGRHKRVFPSGAIAEFNKDLENSETKRAGKLMKMLRADGLEPKMEKTPGGRMFLRIDDIPGHRIPVSLHMPRAID